MPIVVGAAFALGAIGFAATWPGFNPKRITVRGNHLVARSEILAHAAIAPHESVWLQNTRAMAARIEAIPYIDTATVYRIPPAAVTIAVTERAPFAVLRSGENEAQVDRALRVLTLAVPDDTLPVFAIRSLLELSPGEFVKAHDAVELRKTYEAMVARGMVPAQLEFDRFGGVVATLHGGLRLLLGDDNDLTKKVSLADAILSQVVARQRRVAAIDLRAPATPVLVYR
jgi:cell division protein FtsQ